MRVVDADPSDYFERMLVAAEPGGGAVSEIALRQAAWFVAWEDLLTRADLTPTAARLARRQGFVLTRAQLRAAGITDAELRRHLRAGRWSMPRRGIVSVLPREAPEADGPCGLAAPVLAAAAMLARPGGAISHTSALLLQCLPVLDRPVRPVLTSDSRKCAGGEAGVLVHRAALSPDDIVRWFGVPVTSVARAVVDVARDEGVAAGLVVADAALRERLVIRSELRNALTTAAGWPGVRRARRVVELADGRAESPLESLTRLCLIDGGIAVEPQQWIGTSRGRYRVDLLVDGERVIVEADGMLKYRPDEQSRSNPLVREKLRQEALEQAGYEVVRVTWDEARNQQAQTVRRVRAAVARAKSRAYGGAEPDFGRKSGSPTPLGAAERRVSGSW